MAGRFQPPTAVRACTKIATAARSSRFTLPTCTASCAARRSATTCSRSRPRVPASRRTPSRSDSGWPTGDRPVIAQIVALFGAGVASFLAPCIIPLVPAYLGIIVGEMGDAHDPARAVPATVIFIAGFTTVFAGLGALAGLLGSSLETFQDGVRVVGGVLIIVMGLALLGIARGPLARERRLIPSLPKVTGVARPYVVGIAFGAGWSPCVGPLLAAALTIAAREGEVLRGTILLSAYAMGIGVPFLFAALGLASSPGLAERLRRIGPNLERISGVFLIVLGVLLTTNTYVHLTSYLARFVPAVRGL